jgi:hypothetical protein
LTPRYFTIAQESTQDFLIWLSVTDYAFDRGNSTLAFRSIRATHIVTFDIKASTIEFWYLYYSDITRHAFPYARHIGA